VPSGVNVEGRQVAETLRPSGRGCSPDARRLVLRLRAGVLQDFRRVVGNQVQLSGGIRPNGARLRFPKLKAQLVPPPAGLFLSATPRPRRLSRASLEFHSSAWSLTYHGSRTLRVLTRRGATLKRLVDYRGFANAVLCELSDIRREAKPRGPPTVIVASALKRRYLGNLQGFPGPRQRGVAEGGLLEGTTPSRHHGRSPCSQPVVSHRIRHGGRNRPVWCEGRVCQPCGNR
jgi:hypothetical protein